MPDTKITALTALTAADPANDVLPIVDVSDTTMAASGTTKKISINNVLGASGTATLASATISGNLTVDTNTFFVDSANNRVIVGHTSGSSAFQVTNAGAAGLEIQPTGFSSAPLILSYNRSAPAYTQLTLDGSTIVHALSGSTAMTLNSTGLGVGVSPAFKLQVVGTSGSLVDFCGSGVAGLQTLVRLRTATGNTNGLLIQGNVSNDEMYINNFYNAALSFGTNNTERLRIDSSGNVGIGVTPSAWGSNWKANHVGTVGSFASSGAGSAPPTAMVIGAYNDNTNWKYQFSSTGAARYEMTGANAGSAHAWYTSPGGTVNTNITDFATPKMTLDASGNLLVGTTSQNGSWNTKLTLSNDSGTTKWAVGPYLGGVTNFLISAGAAAGVYLNGTAATSWTSASDERLKDIIEPISNAIAKVGSLRAVIGKFKFDENNTRKPFLIAQDIQAVLPEAVDASNPEKLGVAYTEVIPLLVAAIKELTARVQTLETR